MSNDLNINPNHIKPSAQIIADSISPDGTRLVTMEVTMHRFVLAEFNTHRKFSRSSASSRAIPVWKRLEMVRQYPAVPVEFRKERGGMQGGDLLTGKDLELAEHQWLRSSQNALAMAKSMLEAPEPMHKSIINRILEPYLWHTVIVSSTEWDNFFKQRCSTLAQPEIRVVAELMENAYNRGIPEMIYEYEWHMPYILHEERMKWGTDKLMRISVARCARVSYLNHDGKYDPDADLALFDKLVEADPPHWAPLEMVATPQTDVRMGNFDGWRQLRHSKTMVDYLMNVSYAETRS